MKILIGVIVALVLGLAGAGWGLKQSLAREATAREQLAGAQAALEQAENQNKTLVARFDTLDTVLKGLSDSQQKNQAELTVRLATIKNIVQEPQDDPIAIQCLDVRVPAQFDRGLR